MTRYFECHITMFGAKEPTKDVVKNMPGLWIFSSIDGDPDLGDGVKCYATRQYKINIAEDAVIATLSAAADYLRARQIHVLREKIEIVIYDKRIQ